MVCVLGVYILLAAATLFLCGGFNRAASSPQVKDPYELKNVYNETAPAIRDALAKKREGDIDGARASLRAAKAKAAEAEATRDAAT